MNKMASRLTALRALMTSQPTALAAYVIPTADAHNSEYIAPVDARREWISGFTGSAGTAVVTATVALVWTDGRYYTQFEKEADLALWTLMKQSLPDTPSLEKWLSSNLAEGAVVGVDPHTMNREEWTPLESALNKANMKLVAVASNLVDEVRAQLCDPPPARPHHDIMPLPVKYTGKKAGEKINELRQRMSEKKAAALVITALDEVAYTLNLRGSDIDYNPVFFSYLLLTPTAVKLFWGEGKLPPSVKKHLEEEGVEGIECLPYSEVEGNLVTMAKELSERGDGKHSVWLPVDASEAIHRAAAGLGHVKKPLTLISEVSPVALAKMIKNDVELEGFRQCHVRDGTAVVRFLRWLHQQVDQGASVTEIQAADKLLEFRKDETDFMGPSFETIAGAGENGAIIHYSPAREGPQRVIQSKDMFLLDSGGQYKDGTTDITRTRHMSLATPQQRAAFTRVLKGQIRLGSALFPQGVKGNVLDSFARSSLWDVGLDYAHGTGHGVGHCLNVHEGPAGVSWRPYPHDPGLKDKQILSNEPGYYKVGEYGIRHEDLVETILVTKDSDHPKAAGLVGDYEGRGVLGFHTITVVPHQAHSVDVTLLDDFELSYLNAYHARVLATVGPTLRARGLEEDYEWLRAECQPLRRE
ncbi:xaa-Pro aminopeptidase ApepP isoform X2 [Pectinophora gossypiella]|nr:xaa-Pro aminopeptidase ApepP isoform X2 [Pectinophora gossypiella]XP_049884134.1 xaa-Pro aminopeptidase ApepP isoform X2 [Pectinophora gossypiella]XP_049884135.1 xaa-Pro aminopeptidase ApepP isoform X2 [Pectinophora gossypiella]